MEIRMSVLFGQLQRSMRIYFKFNKKVACIKPVLKLTVKIYEVIKVMLVHIENVRVVLVSFLILNPSSILINCFYMELWICICQMLFCVLSNIYDGAFFRKYLIDAWQVLIYLWSFPQITLVSRKFAFLETKNSFLEPFLYTSCTSSPPLFLSNQLFLC